MKNLFHLVSSIILVLCAFMLPACERENLLADRPQTNVKKVAKNPEQISNVSIDPGCLLKGYSANDAYPFMPKNNITFHCFYLTKEPDGFVEGCPECASTVPDLRTIGRPDPWDYNVFSVNEKVLCVQFYNLTQNRNANYFILREKATLSREIAEELAVTRRIVPAGRYNVTYDAARELYVAFITLQ